MQHASETLLLGAGRRAARVSLVLVALGLAPARAQEKPNEAAIRTDIALARGLAEEWQYVDLAEEVIARLEASDLTPELKQEVGLVKCEVYASGARRESDPMRRDELFAQAVDAYSAYIRKNPLSEFLGDAQRGYVDVSNLAARSLEHRYAEAVGEEAEALRQRINGLLEEALQYTSDLKDSLRLPPDDWPVAMKAEWARVMFNRAQMYHTMARISDEGTFFYTQAERTLEELASVVGETTPPGLAAYQELAAVYMSQGRARDAADFAEFIVNTAYPQDVKERTAQGFDDLTAEEKAKRWAFVERSTATLSEALNAAGSPEAAVQWALHFYNTWKREGFSLSPEGYVSLLAVARTMLDAGGHIGGNLAQGDLVWYETVEELEANTTRRNRRSALDLALSIAQTVNAENKGNVLQVRAQKLIADVISRPGVQVSPEVLFQAAQGELNNGNYTEAVAGLKRVMRALEGGDDQMRIEYGGRVAYYLGEAFRKQDRMLEAAMAYREGAANYGADPEFGGRNAKNFSTAVGDLRSKAAGVKEYEDLRAEADRLMLDLTEDIDEIVLRQAKGLYDQDKFVEARAKYQEVPAGSPVREKAITYAALCLKKLNDDEAARKELAEYLSVYVPDPTHQVTTSKGRASRLEARAMATYYLGTISFENNEHQEAIQRLATFHEEFPDQTSYAPTALYMVVLSHLELGDMDAVRAAHDTMVDLFPTNKFTGAAATKIFNTLLARRDAAQKAGDDARATELARDMARYIHLGNELDPTPNFVNLRTESTLWKELGEHEQAEDVLESLVRRFADDPERKNDLERFVKPDLGEVLLAQKRAQEAFDVLDELVPDPEDASDPRKPSSRVVESWCRAVSGWVESDPEGQQITPVPGVGGAEHLEDACTYWNKLLDAAKANPGAWTQPWYERYFETAYGYYQWGQVDSERLNTARAQLELLRTELGDDLGMLEDEGLRKRLLWLWGKVR